jgi:hypothetical protein
VETGFRTKIMLKQEASFQSKLTPLALIVTAHFSISPLRKRLR